MEMVEQFKELLHPYLLESLATDDLDGAYDQPTQPWGEWNQAVKTNEVPCAEDEQFVCRFMGVGFRGPGMEKIRDCLAFLTLENYINQSAVVFSVSDLSWDILALKIKVTEANFQTEKEKSLPIQKTFAVLI